MHVLRHISTYSRFAQIGLRWKLLFGQFSEGIHVRRGISRGNVTSDQDSWYKSSEVRGCGMSIVYMER